MIDLQYLGYKDGSVGTLSVWQTLSDKTLGGSTDFNLSRVSITLACHVVCNVYLIFIVNINISYIPIATC